MTFRKTIFWAHLAAGLIAGAVIGIMSFTGAALAFEKEIVAWAERDARRVTPPSPDAPRLPLAELQNRLRAAQPEARPMGVTLENDPRAAVTFATGRTGGFYVDPYTGAVRQPASTKVHDFLRVLVEWHRVLAFTGENRAVGKAINGACNVAFCVLAITGLYLWWPRKWRTKGLKRSVWFMRSATSKARDWNWHNVIGLWSAPVLIVLTATAFPISYRWGGNLIYTLTGTEAPVVAPGAQGGGPGLAAAPAVEIPTPPGGTPLLSHDALLALVQKQTPQWETISIRTGAPIGRGGPRGAGAGTPAGGEARPSGEARGQAREGGARRAPAASGTETAAASTRSAGESRSGEARPAGEGRSAAPQPVTFTIRTGTSWPRTASTTLTLNPYTGEILRTAGYADLNAAQKVRSWTRFLHTGEALGWGGQLIAGLASLGACVLVYTGFALSWRRFFGKSSAPATPPPTAAV